MQHLRRKGERERRSPWSLGDLFLASWVAMVKCWNVEGLDPESEDTALPLDGPSNHLESRRGYSPYLAFLCRHLLGEPFTTCGSHQVRAPILPRVSLIPWSPQSIPARVGSALPGPSCILTPRLDLKDIPDAVRLVAPDLGVLVVSAVCLGLCERFSRTVQRGLHPWELVSWGGPRVWGQGSGGSSKGRAHSGNPGGKSRNCFRKVRWGAWQDWLPGKDVPSGLYWSEWRGGVGGGREGGYSPCTMSGGAATPAVK